MSFKGYDLQLYLTASTPSATPKCQSTNRDIINLIKQQQNRNIIIIKEKPGKSQETLKKLKTGGQATPIIHRNLLQAVKSPLALNMNKSKSGKNVFHLQSQQPFLNSASQNISKMNTNEKNSSLKNSQPSIIRSNQKAQNLNQETSNKKIQRQSKWNIQEEIDEEKQKREKSQRSAKEHLENIQRISNLRINENQQNPESPQKDLNLINIKDTIIDSNLKVCNEPTEVSMTNIDNNETKPNVRITSQREYQLNSSSADSSLERDSNSSEIRAEIGESFANIQPKLFQDQAFGEEYHPIQINRQKLPESGGWHGVLVDQLNIEKNEQTSSSLGKRNYADYKHTKQSNNSQENVKKTEAFIKIIQNGHKNQDETYKAIQDLNKEIQSREKVTPCRKVKPANLRQDQSSGLRRNFSDNFDQTWIENSAKKNFQVENTSQVNLQFNQTKFSSAVIGNFCNNGGQTPEYMDTQTQIVLFGDLSQDLRLSAQKNIITNKFIHEQMSQIKSDVAISQNDNRSMHNQMIQKNIYIPKFNQIQEQTYFKNFDENSKQSGSTIDNIQNKQSFDLTKNYLPNFHLNRKLQNLQAQEPLDEKDESYTEEELEKQTPQFQKACALHLSKNLFQKKFEIDKKENEVKYFQNQIPKTVLENQTSVKKILFQEDDRFDQSSSNLSQTPENHKRMKLKNSFSSMNSASILPQPFMNQPISQNFMHENQQMMTDPNIMQQIAFCKPILKQQSHYEGNRNNEDQVSGKINIRLFKNTSSAKSLSKLQSIQNQQINSQSQLTNLVLCQELQDGSFSARNLEFAAISNEGCRQTVYSEKMKQEGILNFVTNQKAIQTGNWKKGVHFKALVSSEERRNSECARDQEVVSSKSSLIQRWRGSDGIFAQKYQNGTEKPLQNAQDDSSYNLKPESINPNCNIIFENQSGQDSYSQLGLVKQRSTMNQMSSPSLANQAIFKESFAYKTFSNYDLNNTLGNKLPQSIQNNFTGERNRLVKAHNFDERNRQNATSWPFSASLQSKAQIQKFYQPPTDHNPIFSDSKVTQLDQQISIIWGPNNEKISDKIRLNNTARLNQDMLFQQNQVIEIQDQGKEHGQLRQFYIPDQTFKEEKKKDDSYKDEYVERQKGAGYRARQSYAQDLQVNTANLIRVSEMHRRDIPMSTGGISIEDPRTPVETQNCWLQQSQVSATGSSQNDCDGISSSLDTETNEQLGQYRYGKKGNHPAKIANFKVGGLYKEESIIPRSKLFAENQDSISSNNFHQNYIVSKFNISQKSTVIEKPFNPNFNRNFFASNESGELKEMNNAAFEAKSQGGKVQLDLIKSNDDLYEDVNFPKVQINNQSKKKISGQEQQQNQTLLSWMDREFERLTKLGNGNFGQVIKCRNKTDGYEYAIKVTNIKNPQHSQSYLQEMQTLSALSAGSESPHIVRYFNSWVEKDKIYIVMELCQKSLLDIKREYKTKARLGYELFMPEKQLRKIIRDVLLGLQELHEGNIVHLDIKPGNILLGKSNNYKLGDLGLARFLTKITELTHIPEGDCRYLAQELLSKENFREIPDLKKADIFSVGITAYELLTMEDLEKNGKEWRKFRNGEFAYPKLFYEGQYSQQLLDSIAQMISPDPEARPNASDLLQNVFLSEEQERILFLEQENEKLREQILQLERRF